MSENSNQVYASPKNKYPIIVPAVNNIKQITSTGFAQPSNQLTISPDNGNYITIPQALNQSNVVVSGNTGTWLVLTGDFGGQNIPPGPSGSRVGVVGFQDAITSNNAQLVFSTPPAPSFATITLQTNGKAAIVVEDMPMNTKTTINTDLVLSTLPANSFLYLDANKKVTTSVPSVNPVFNDTLFSIVDTADNTKRIMFDVTGNSGVTTTFSTTSLANQTITFPNTTDTVVTRANNETLTNKTINGANNTITGVNHLSLLNIGTNTHAQIDTHIANTSNPHLTTLNQANSAQGLCVNTGDLFYYAGTGFVALPVGNAWSVLRTNSVGVPIWNDNIYIQLKTPLSLTQTLTLSTPYELTITTFGTQISRGNVSTAQGRIVYTGIGTQAFLFNFSVTMRLNAGTNRNIKFDATNQGFVVATWTNSFANTTNLITTEQSFIATMTNNQQMQVFATEQTSTGAVVITQINFSAVQI